MSLQDTDSGFSWIILCASFLNYTLVSGTIRTFGILYAELLQTYHKGAGNTAFLGSIMFFVMAITGPVSGLMSVHFSFKWCTMIGGLISSIGMVISSLTQDIEMLYLTYSCLLGIGFGLSAPPTVTIINFYFEKKRAFANGFLTASMGLSLNISFFIPKVDRSLWDTWCYVNSWWFVTQHLLTVGIFPGILHSLQPLLVVTSLGLTMLPTALPLSSFFSNTACLIGHPSLGWLEDYTGNWKASFYTVGGLFIASSLCVLLERKLVKATQSEEMKVRTDNVTEVTTDNIAEVTTNNQNNTKNIHCDDVNTSLMHETS
ncbi:unnamed protein product [Mytilus coruscus]|uniref:Uncharacterized protein n=1 Tax=Mytilus coruscus TaxID=42192 RepID=A0A6J8E3K8_MYTCO|nr:unnamed protein product [Mytilus coruscus]